MIAKLKGLLSVVAIVTVTLASGLAPGGTPSADTRSRALYARAESSFAKGAFDEALALYQAAHALTPLPGFLYNIGQCHRFVGRYQRALEFYRRYLSSGSARPSRSSVERVIAHVEQQLARRARVAPPPTSAPTSRPAATASAPARPPAVATASARPRDPRPAPTARPTPSPSTPPPSDASRRSTILLWSGVGLTSALLISALATGQMASDRSSAYNDPATAPDRRAALKSSGEALAGASVTSFALAAAAGAATTLHWWLGHRRGAPVVSAVPLDAGGGLSLSGSF